MVSKAAQHKPELIERVKALASARLPADRATALSEYIAQFYANVAVDDLVGEAAENLYAASLSLWGFAAQRVPGTAKVRVYNPRLDEQGWHSAHTVVEMVNDDMPFLVDSLTAALNQRDLMVYLVIHPIVRVRRDRAGNRVAGAAGEEIAESHIQIRINEQTAPERLAEIKFLLEKVLADVRAATADWPQMRARAGRIATLYRAKSTSSRRCSGEISYGIRCDSSNWIHDPMESESSPGNGARIRADASGRTAAWNRMS